jgi:hypothetical protein
MVSVREAIEGADLSAFGDALAPGVVRIGLYPGELCRSRADVLDMLYPTREAAIEAVEARP